MTNYEAFLAAKAVTDPFTGISEFPPLPDCLFPHQRDIVSWALRRGRSALFAGTGLGKSLMELAWGQVVAETTGKPVLHLAPLAVSSQLVREADKFGISARLVTKQSDCESGGICVTNYQKIEHFDVASFGGVILDESSILKSTDGHYRNKLIEDCQVVPFRLAATATPAPNDFMELGNHAEFLGVMSYTDMLATFFVHDGGSTQNWRLKGHAENEFWKWMASWAVMLRKPSDLGYPNEGYDLPPLHYHQHTVGVEYRPSIETGMLFPIQAATLSERISARRDTASERVAMLADIVMGDFCLKLATWHGNQNTPLAGEKNISHPPTSGNGGAASPDADLKTPNTCAPITKSIQSGSSEAQNSKSASTNSGAQNTHPTPPTGQSARPLQNLDRPKNGGMADCQSTESTVTTTPPCPQAKEENAPYADVSQSAASMLTIAMTAAKSEGFFAVRATPASVISAMTQNGSIEPWCIWCNLNSEQDALAKAFGPLAYSVSGSMTDDQKEASIMAWMDGERPIMISKPSIMGFGMNFQHCRNTAFVGLTDSFEQFYQAIRRFWRFGQTQPVNCHIIAAETEGATVANIKRKESDAERMAAAMVLHMADLSSLAVRGSVRDRADYNPQQSIILPDFIRGNQ